MEIPDNWQQRIGSQRDWVWRGWQTRYTFLGLSQPKSPLKPPLILLHGFGACIEHWRYNLPVLSQQYPVYALDLLGFGGSRKASTDYTVSLWVEQVYDFWRTFIAHPVILVGNSLGSLVCLVAAATYPALVRGIVLLNVPDVSLRQEMLPSWLGPLVTTVERIVASPPLLKLLFPLLRRPSIIRRWAGIAYANPSLVSDELVEIIAAPAQDEGASATFAALCQAVNSPQFSPPVKAILPVLQIPILLIWGQQDRMVPPQLAPRFASLNSQIKWIELEQAGHCPHDECPREFNRLLLDWLAVNFGKSERP